MARRKTTDAATARRQLELAREAEVGLSRPDSTVWLERLDDSHDEREQTFAWFLEHNPQQGLEMAAALLGYWNTRGLYDEGQRWSDALLAKVPERTLARAKALYGAGVMAFRRGDTEGTRTLTEESLALARDVDDPATVVLALAGLGRVGLRDGDYSRVMELSREGLARADAFYTVVCDDGNEYESVDARAVDNGHKDDAVRNFSENTPFGLSCWLEGPFTP